MEALAIRVRAQPRDGAFLPCNRQRVSQEMHVR
jgi:hypothetical protein